MKKIYTLTLAGLLCGAMQADAAPRSMTEARRLAQDFFAAKHGLVINTDQVELVDNAPRRKATNRTSIDTPYYIFNNDNRGFVIVSGSDLTSPILGYSDQATFTNAQLPDNLEGWFNMMSDAIEFIERNPQAAISAEQRSALSNTEIAPLLGNTMWDQTSPYNTLCPAASPTGCMATAMAQVMRYFKFPQKGVGSDSYSWTNPTTGTAETLAVNFAEHTYEWDLMEDTYTRSTSHSEASRAAVAKISYHAGVSLHMNYNPSGSGSTAAHYYRALVNDFGYNPHVSTLCRAVFPFDEWNSVLLNELQQKRPILHGGQSNVGGHAYVVDGYKDGLYHVNWGWNGSYNGYYDICILRPEGAGSGASLTEQGFCWDQYATINITPEQNVGTKYTPLYATNFTTTASTGKITTAIKLAHSKVYNYCPTKFVGQWGYVLKQGNEVVHKQAIKNISIPGAQGVYYYFFTDLIGYVKLPSTLANGTYRLYTYVQEDGSDLYDIVRCYVTDTHYLTVKITDGQFTITLDSAEPNITASNWSSDKESYSTGREIDYTIDMTNAGTSTHVGKYILTYTSISNGKSYTSTSEVLTIAPGETKTAHFRPLFDVSGKWTLSLATTLQNLATNDGSGWVEKTYTMSGQTKTMEVEADPSYGGNFTLTATPTILTSGTTFPLDSEISFSLPVRNDGDNYVGKFVMRFYSSSSLSASSYVGEIVQDNVSVAGNGTTATVTVTGKLSSEFLAAMKKYYAVAHFIKITDRVKMAAATGVTNRVEVKVTNPDPNGIEAITSSDTEYIDIFNLLGKHITRTVRKDTPAAYDLPAGVYVIEGKKVVVK